jgi:hypothetical protein
VVYQRESTVMGVVGEVYQDGRSFPFEAYQGWTSDRDAVAIRDEVKRRELVADWLESIDDRQQHERDRRWVRITGAVAAFLVSALGVGMFFALALTLGAR